MVVDTSAIVAAIAMEPDAVRFRAAMLGATSLAMSSATVLESKIVLHSRHGAAAVDAFDQMLEAAAIAIVPFDAQMAQLAFDVFRRYGKRQGHPAQLNIIDCTVYALARFATSHCYSRAATSRRPIFRRRCESGRPSNGR
jgi:ribonuclease VapC